MGTTILGCGTIGEAILGGLLEAGTVPRDQLRATCRRPDREQEVRERYGITVGSDNREALAGSDVAILCTKPQGAAALLEELAGALEGKLLISTCAGLRIEQLEELAPGARIVRAMPNTPALIGEGMTVLSPGRGASEQDLETAEAIFRAVGRCLILDESHMDAVTGLSGSGPAFAFVVLEALADGGVMMGLPRAAALELAAQSLQGAARLVLAGGQHPAALKDEVTTPAGCTIAGLLVMEDRGVRATLARAIQEAARVAGGLGDSK